MTANSDNCNRAHSMAENARERCTTTDVHKSHQIQILFLLLPTTTTTINTIMTYLINKEVRKKKKVGHLFTLFVVGQ